jgi:N-acetylglucosamine-6-phosphate deacetylase
MQNRTFIINGKVITPHKEKCCAIVLENGRIAEMDFRGDIPENAHVIDASGMYVAPGFVEIHAHGGGGFDFMDATENAFEKIADIHAEHGVTSILPTTVAAGQGTLESLFSIYRDVTSRTFPIHFLGLHLEGPFISDAMRGAQNPKYIRKPSESEIDWLMDTAGDIIRMCTGAPEIDGAEYMARTMAKHKITLSIGHSNATFEQIKRGMDWGFRHITHLYSNTPGVRKIDQVVHAGVLEAAYFFDDMRIELIGDGHHVPKEVAQLALKIKGADRINMTTDAMRAAGTKVKESFLGEVKPENRVIIEDGVAKLPDRSFYAGSIATGDIILKWLVNTCGFSLPEATAMLSLSPAKVIGADAYKGSIEKGKDADILLLDEALNVKKILIKGNEKGEEK